METHFYSPLKSAGHGIGLEARIMSRFRNPRYAPEFLERRLHPSSVIPIPPPAGVPGPGARRPGRRFKYPPIDPSLPPLGDPIPPVGPALPG